MVTHINISVDRAWQVLKNVTDPEIPVLSVLDLGIVRKVEVKDGKTVVEITPTYSGCPAIDVISISIKMELLAAGFETVVVKQVLSPAWTTDWMTEDGKQKLKEYGIAPPNAVQQVCHPDLFAAEESVACPQCNSHRTKRLSEFGSTACKSLYQCNDCSETFDYFKCH